MKEQNNGEETLGKRHFRFELCLNYPEKVLLIEAGMGMVDRVKNMT